MVFVDANGSFIVKKCRVIVFLTVDSYRYMPLWKSLKIVSFEAHGGA